MLPARTLAAIRIIFRTGAAPIRPHQILTAELAWVQPAILLSPTFDLETLADPEAYTRLAPPGSSAPPGLRLALVRGYSSFWMAAVPRALLLQLLRLLLCVG